MIYDSLEHLDVYAARDPLLAVVRDFTKVRDLRALEPGRISLDGGVYAIVSDNRTRTEGKYEAHRRYADFQLVIEGEEIIECAPIEDMRFGGGYDAEGDAELFDCAPESAVQIKLREMQFLVLYPQDAHKPLLRWRSDTSRKIIFKIPV